MGEKKVALKNFDKTAWLQRLERFRYDAKDEPQEDQLEQMSLAAALLALAEINHEREYALCRTLAEHLLGEVPEPDDVDLGEE